jgi:16S rRNA pseudouridine516 synthase
MTIFMPRMQPMRRLDQILSSFGYCTRRESERFIDEGRVKIAGELAERGDQRVDPALVTVEDEPLEGLEGLLVMLHKPVGYACTHSEREKPTIYELLPEHWLKRNPAVTSIGRLDKDTSGLILITDQGSLVQRYTSPKSEIDKVYVAEVDRDLDTVLIEVFARGDLMLHDEEKPCLPARLEIVSPRTARLTIMEGRYHQVRRMFASQGWHVETLHRERFGPHELDDLKPGEWRMLDLPLR